MPSRFKIKFIADEKEIYLNKGENIYNASVRAGVDIGSICGGRGFCGKCKVKIIGKVSNPTEIEKKILTKKELDENIRLACQAYPLDNIEVISIYNKIAKLAKFGYEPEISLKPTVTLRIINNFGIIEYWENSKKKEIEVISEKYRDDKKIYGLGIDIGTTKIVIYVVDLISGKNIFTIADENPQVVFGADVMTRIMKALEVGVDKLQKSVISFLNDKIDELEMNGVSSSDIYEIVIVGNSVMEYFFLGMDPKPLAYAPYKLTFKGPDRINAKDLNIKINSKGKVYVPPLVESFVGSDSLVGAYLMKYKSIENYLFIDLGTNVELYLSSLNHKIATSGPAGPAFEGMNIKYGMRAMEGAIEGIAIDPETLEPKLKVIGDKAPCGIAGSALIDAVAEMLKNGIIDYHGRFKSINHPYIIKNEEGTFEYILTKHGCSDKLITITQKDVRELQLAKAAVQTAIRILLRKTKISIENIEKIYIAGSFGFYMNPQSAIYIGLLPEVPIDKIELVGNTAGSGSRILLKDRDERRNLENFSKKIVHINLAKEKDFHQIFINSTYLPSGYLEDYPNVIRNLEKILGKPNIKIIKKL